MHYDAWELLEHYGSIQGKDFAPLALKACRSEFIQPGLSRRECNRRTRLIKQAFKWGVSDERVPPHVYHGLQAVSGLAAGRTESRDPKPVGPVPEPIVEWTIDLLTGLSADRRFQCEGASTTRPAVHSRLTIDWAITTRMQQAYRIEKGNRKARTTWWPASSKPPSTASSGMGAGASSGE
jgi:hypothetical protein